MSPPSKSWRDLPDPIVAFVLRLLWDVGNGLFNALLLVIAFIGWQRGKK